MTFVLLPLGLYLLVGVAMATKLLIEEVHRCPAHWAAAAVVIIMGPAMYLYFFTISFNHRRRMRWLLQR